MPHNVQPVMIQTKSPNAFLKLEVVSSDLEIKRIQATIEGEVGEFFGLVSKLTSSPSGFGVLKTGDWVHCGSVNERGFT